MGLKSWLVRHKLQAQIRLWQIKLDAERAKLAGGKEGGMPVWLHTLLVVFGGGALASASDALVNGFTLDKPGITRLVTASVAGGAIALAAWLKQSPLVPKGDSALPERLKGAGKLLLFGLLPLIPMAGCASLGGAQASIFPGRPKGVDQGVLEQLVCRGAIKDAEVYAQDRGASRAEVTEVVERAREAVTGKPGCCLTEGACVQ